MSQLWFYGKLGSRLGPFTALQLRVLADAGKILVTDTVWKDGIDLGVLATRVKNLFPIPVVPLFKEIVPPILPPAVAKPPSPEIAIPETTASDAPASAGSALLAQKTVSQPVEPKKLVKKLRA